MKLRQLMGLPVAALQRCSAEAICRWDKLPPGEFTSSPEVVLTLETDRLRTSPGVRTRQTRTATVREGYRRRPCSHICFNRKGSAICDRSDRSDAMTSRRLPRRWSTRPQVLLSLRTASLPHKNETMQWLSRALTCCQGTRKVTVGHGGCAGGTERCRRRETCCSSKRGYANLGTRCGENVL